MAGFRQSKDDAAEEQTRLGWRMAGIGFETTAQVAAGALLGFGFDAWQGTSPTGVLVGGVLGIAVAMWTLIKGTLKLNRQLDAATRRRSSSTTQTSLKPPPDHDDSTHDHNPADL